jgi:hypothetical protein
MLRYPHFMRQRWRARLRAFSGSRPGLLLAVLLSLAMAASGSNAVAKPDASTVRHHGGVLVAAQDAHGLPRGLWLVAPDGKTRQFLARKWVPLSRSSQGSTAVIRSDAQFESASLNIVRGLTRRVIPTARGAGCVSWSADGTALAYVTGSWTVERGPSPQDTTPGWTGDLWTVRPAVTVRPQRVDSGFFPTSECPSWSQQGARLAYVVRRGGQSENWIVAIAEGRKSEIVARIDTQTMSTHFRTFAWGKGNALYLIDGLDIYRTSPSGIRPIAQRILEPVDARRTPRASTYQRTLSVSPGGSYLGASIGDSTAVFRPAGQLVSFAHGHLMGWSGNVGILTEGLHGNTPTLYRYPIAGGNARIVQLFFKLTVVSDPAGTWFAYADPEANVLVFRKANGRTLRRVQLPFRPVVLAAMSASGQVEEPAGTY